MYNKKVGCIIYMKWGMHVNEERIFTCDSCECMNVIWWREPLWDVCLDVVWNMMNPNTLQFPQLYSEGIP